MAATRELVRKSRLERAEDILGAAAHRIQKIEKHVERQDEAYEFLFGLMERRTLRGRWRQLKRWLA